MATKSMPQKKHVGEDDNIDPTVNFPFYNLHLIMFFSCQPNKKVFFLCYVYQYVCLQQYLQNRLASLALAKASGINPYPHKFMVSMSVTEFIATYGSLDAGEHVETIEVSLAGTNVSNGLLNKLIDMSGTTIILFH